MTDGANHGGGDVLVTDSEELRKLTPIERRTIEAAVEIQMSDQVVPSYMHSALCQLGLPRNATDARTFERTNGAASLKIRAGDLWNGSEWVEHPLPYGAKPRLVLVHICTQAVLTGKPDIEVGHSVREFLHRLGIESTGGLKGSYTSFRKQMLALAACEMRLGIPTKDGPKTVKAPPISEFLAWIPAEEGQRVMWPGVMTLSTPLFESLREHAVPLRQEALAALKHSALALDIYAWLAHRLCRIRQDHSVRVYWKNLRDQFGQEYHDTRRFKVKFRIALRQALAVYQDANVEEGWGGLLLKASPPPIPRTNVLVQSPSRRSGNKT